MPPDRQVLLDWLLHQPLMLQHGNHLIVHAGIWPQWKAEEVQQRAAEVAAALQSRPRLVFCPYVWQ